MNVLVVGAGISGSTIANMLSEENRVTIIDLSSNIAGNCHDYRDDNGIMVHKYGSHIFHSDNQQVWDFLSRFTTFNNYHHKVVGMIGDVEVPIPFNYNSIDKVFDKDIAISIEEKLYNNYSNGSKISIMDFLKQDDEELKLLADYIYENIFLHYTEKQWGKTPDEIDESVTARVPVYLSRDDCFFQNRFQGIPLKGYTKMIENMLDQPNITVRLNTSFKEVESLEFDKIFYTGSIDELMNYCFGVLPYRSVYFKLEVYDMDHYQSNAVINYPNDQDYTRIHEYKYYLDDISERTVIAKEYSEDFVPGKNGRFYPIITKENIALYDKYLELTKKKYPNMYFLGRLGDYKYYDMDKAVARAFEVYEEAMN